MNPNRGETPANFEVSPQPTAPEGEPRQERTAEAPAARPETSGSRPKAPALPAIPQDIPAADQPAAPAPSPAAPAAHSSPQAGTHDGDHIEREWVDKVKNVASSTRDDPYKQKSQMSQVKADYIQKRFNKTVKTDDTAA